MKQYNIHYRLESVRYMQQVIPWVHQSSEGKRYLDRFPIFYKAHRLTETDRPRYSVIHNRRHLPTY